MEFIAGTVLGALLGVAATWLTYAAFRLPRPENIGAAHRLHEDTPRDHRTKMVG